ncbi:MAG TPA: helix-turn-helix domain-containing protein [Spirochaetota bacterium]|nr:helix-turn-helix domain-containing protein [Spirochaetota bacterium]
MDKMNLPDIFLLAGSLNGFILAIAIYRARSKEGRAWIFLCMLVLVFSAGIAVNKIVYLFFHDIKNHSFFIKMIFLMTGPTIYLYVKTVIGDKVRKVEVINYLPVFIVVCMFVFSASEIAGDRTQYVIRKALHVVIGLQLTIYCVLSYRLILRNCRSAAEVYSQIENFRLSWLRFLIGCYAVAILLAGIIDITDNRITIVYEWDIYWIYVSCVVYMIGYKGLRQPEIWKEKKDRKLVSGKKYRKTGLDSCKSENCRILLEKAMTEMVFLDPDLSLPSLADIIGIPVHHLSQVINETGMNFHEFINRRRFEYAKYSIEVMDDPINMTRIAFDSGFNSISSFNAIFRKYGKMTPSEWRNVSRNKRACSN